LIAGQLAMAPSSTAFGLFGLEQIPIGWTRLLGIALLALGAALYCGGRRPRTAPAGDRSVGCAAKPSRQELASTVAAKSGGHEDSRNRQHGLLEADRQHRFALRPRSPPAATNDSPFHAATATSRERAATRRLHPMLRARSRLRQRRGRRDSTRRSGTIRERSTSDQRPTPTRRKTAITCAIARMPRRPTCCSRARRGW
jgi:hypothetical protein